MGYEEMARAASAEHMLAEFPDLESLHTRPSSAGSSTNASTSDSEVVFLGHNKEQIRLMNEACIVVDYNDVPYAAGSKKTLHLMSSINKGLLHRAFSVFLFNSAGKLLLQQRASEKITFPDLWTNTCCSHPLAIRSERGPSDDLEGYVFGVKNAAVRKLGHELGIPASEVPLESFKFLTRIHYMAPSSGLWGEHEVDYILFVKADPTVKAEINEVRDTMWVSQDQLKAMFGNKNYHFTPWFKLICENFLFAWWSDGELVKSDDKIRRML